MDDVIISVKFAQCDGCKDRVEADHLPDTWRIVRMNARANRMYCSSLCYSVGDGTPRETILAARLARFNLSPTDIETLGYLARGRSDSEIKRALGLARSTIKNRLSLIYTKLGVEDRLQAVLVAGHLGLIDLPTLGAEIRRATLL